MATGPTRDQGDGLPPRQQAETSAPRQPRVTWTILNSWLRNRRIGATVNNNAVGAEIKVLCSYSQASLDEAIERMRATTPAPTHIYMPRVLSCVVLYPEDADPVPTAQQIAQVLRGVAPYPEFRRLPARRNVPVPTSTAVPIAPVNPTTPSVPAAATSDQRQGTRHDVAANHPAPPVQTTATAARTASTTSAASTSAQTSQAPTRGPAAHASEETSRSASESATVDMSPSLTQPALQSEVVRSATADPIPCTLVEDHQVEPVDRMPMPLVAPMPLNNDSETSSQCQRAARASHVPPPAGCISTCGALQQGRLREITSSQRQAMHALLAGLGIHQHDPRQIQGGSPLWACLCTEQHGPEMFRMAQTGATA